MSFLPARSITDPGWLRSRIGLAARRYGCAPVEVLGTIWWYSASSVLVAPALHALAGTGPAADPALDAITLEETADGRLLDSRSSGQLDGGLPEVGSAMGEALDAAITAVTAVTGAHSPALWAIATDSIANRLVWNGAPDLAAPLVAAIGRRMPAPRYLTFGAHLVVRRASCCLIYQVGQPKCVSCPRQLPADRDRRIRTALTAS
ncbi:MAG TPA: (2Fe-2S)-binding protein [Amycolatopsis sp.]|nr:(2Fe-2S)-binding protein [Amycolatopsis sp.]